MPRTPRWMQSLLEEHFEELQMLWELRSSVLRDPDYRRSDLAELDERIEAHVDGLVLAETNAHPLLLEGLQSPDPLAIFAAAYVLLCGTSPDGITSVFESFDASVPEGLDGFRDAFCHGPWQRIATRLRPYLSSDRADLAAIATEVFSFRGELKVDGSTLRPFLNHELPQVRAAGWRALSYSRK